jgi:hypothetical protein
VRELGVTVAIDSARTKGPLNATTGHSSMKAVDDKIAPASLDCGQLLRGEQRRHPQDLNDALQL